MALGLDKEPSEAETGTEGVTEQKRKKVTVDLGDKTTQETTTPSTEDNSAHGVSGQGDADETLAIASTPITTPSEAVRVEKIGDELLMRDDAGNLLRLHFPSAIHFSTSGSHREAAAFVGYEFPQILSR